MNGMFRRAAALALAAALMLPLAACGKGSDTVGPNNTPAADATPTPEATPTPTPDPYDAVRNYWSEDQLTQAWGPDQVVEHLFFHPVIAYPEYTFSSAIPADRQKGLDDWMVTADEFKKILQSVYDKGYILVNMGDVWSEVTDENGVTRMQRNTLMLPEGKKPLVISFDDVNYYQYMLEEGFTSKLVLGEDGQIWAETKDPFTGEVSLTQDLDATPILDNFVLEHPDFSLNGAKAIYSLTGYEGIFGYRTQNDIDIAADDPARPAFDAKRQAEIEAVKPIIERLKETGWTFGSHTWGHIRLDSRPLESIQRDTVRWAEEVGSLVGPTNILFYPHGGRPDGDDWHTTGPVLQYLQSQGFRIFASVGINSFSHIKSDISAVICDRLHPDGTTLRNGKALKWYEQFYDAREIIDLDVRPDLGTTW
ncbi:polysaccharide deacetylase family protein [Pseudoflavonifractor phocaeensis]|uniref:polysaccharide deacetylase family protein n=1 Tax=Pseudoflavonifractor phocaeensis TaxID=1870988 RepID=UPI0019564CA2|nr:polysaccharide deacetylase family protein [Pseudoflavonifractor phocaeensis]MBM6723608.1 hydrolase [Pseudoflavonifractor phocaeensis]